MGATRSEIHLTMRMLTETATTQVPTRLRYDTADPFAVTLAFDSDAAGPIEWIFARELLVIGVATACGGGDVRIWPAEADDQVFIELSSPSGRALLAAGVGPIRAFLKQTVGLVPFGTELAQLDLDQALQLLLDPDPGVAPI